VESVCSRLPAILSDSRSLGTRIQTGGCRLFMSFRLGEVTCDWRYAAACCSCWRHRSVVGRRAGRASNARRVRLALSKTGTTSPTLPLRYARYTSASQRVNGRGSRCAPSKATMMRPLPQTVTIDQHISVHARRWPTTGAIRHVHQRRPATQMQRPATCHFTPTCREEGEHTVRLTARGIRSRANGCALMRHAA